MRILLVSHGFPPDGQWGTEYYTHQLALGLLARGHEVGVLYPRTVEGNGSRFEALERDLREGTQVYVVAHRPDKGKRLASSYESPRVERLFAELLDEFRPDLVHFAHLLWNLSVRLPLICRERGVATVLTLTDFGLVCHRGQLFDWRLRDCGGPHEAATCARCIREPAPYDAAPARVLAKRWAVRGLALLGGLGRVVTTRDVRRREAVVGQALGAVGHLIAPTLAVRQVFERAGVESERLSLLPYLLDTDPLVGARAEPAREPVTIGYLGQFSPHKGVHTLVEAVRLMAHRLPESVEPWVVRLYGEGATARHRDYPRRVLPGASGPRVELHPRFTSGLAEVLAQLHAVVVPSLWRENAPFAALQARSAGVPILASDVPGVSEIVEDGVHGRLFPPGDARALADLMREVILGRVVRSSAVEPPVSRGEHLDRLESIYRSLVAVAGVPA